MVHRVDRSATDSTVSAGNNVILIDRYTHYSYVRPVRTGLYG